MREFHQANFIRRISWKKSLVWLAKPPPRTPDGTLFVRARDFEGDVTSAVFHPVFTRLSDRLGHQQNPVGAPTQ
jgi:hypothetical protein